MPGSKMGNGDLLRRLAERLARGEISEETYREIRERYEKGDRGSGQVRSTSGGPGDPPQCTPFAERGVGYTGTRFVLAGSGSVEGDVSAETCRIAGSCRISGSVSTEEWRSAGSVDVSGDLKCEMFKSAGSISIGGGISAEDISSAGSCSVGKGARCESLRFAGSLSAKGDIQCETLSGRGRMSAREVSAGSVDLELDGRSRVKVLRGDAVVVRRRGGLLGTRGTLRAEEVHGSKVDLEGVECERVTGERVSIGPGCSITLVEYGSGLRVHQASKVSKRVKVRSG